MEDDVIGIARDWLRVEYSGGSDTPAKLIVPLVVEPGSYSELKIRATPRDGVRLGQSVETGDAFKQTFTTGWTGAMGASFFGSATYGRSRSTSLPQYSVIMTPDFRSVVFQLKHIRVKDAIGVQVAFPVESYSPDPGSTYFAQVHVEVGGKVIEKCVVPQDTHPSAAKVLVVDGFSQSYPVNVGNGVSGPFIMFAGQLMPKTGSEVIEAIASGYDAVHILVGNVGMAELDFIEFTMSIDEFFDAVDAGSTKLVFMSSCNSVNAVSRFRSSNANALVAATENLTEHYAKIFELEFYQALSFGQSLAESYHLAQKKAGQLGHPPFIYERLGKSYSPMFLDMKKDLTFRPHGSAS